MTASTHMNREPKRIAPEQKVTAKYQDTNRALEPDTVCSTPIPSAAWTHWLQEIRHLYALGKSHTFELAWAVYSGRESMARGEWSKLWRSGQAPFSKTRACMLRRIGERFEKPNVQTFERLPGEWSILYELSRLDPSTIQHLIGQGLIHS